MLDKEVFPFSILSTLLTSAALYHIYYILLLHSVNIVNIQCVYRKLKFSSTVTVLESLL